MARGPHGLQLSLRMNHHVGTARELPRCGLMLRAAARHQRFELNSQVLADVLAEAAQRLAFSECQLVVGVAHLG
jgi:hypothetical protein